VGDLIQPLGSSGGGGGGGAFTKTGVYSGDDTLRTIVTGLSGQVRYVRIQPSPNNPEYIKQIDMAGDAVLEANSGVFRTGVTLSGSDFTVDGVVGSADVNTTGQDYYWVAFS